MDKLKEPFKFNPEKLVWGKLNGKYFLIVLTPYRFVSERSQLFHQIDKTVVEILDCLLEEKPKEIIIKRLVEKYNFSVTKATIYFNRFIKYLALLLNEE